ncbi:NAD(P)-binding protein [Schizophyllum commune H4-8]|uniref:NAD(P)-binding protein n=1 Tax=Schizophyllum commune (strain H4-8 / FGSC 9210) TaxID=578458 RepID=UPI0021601E65|nr:NAD(P)-binding protein [Schizophyllum commune H4-8]KAI5889253.1 NAD(P)-binding protein [Schizophyllum commune H4-8]
MPRIATVFGATGTQGSAVVDHLLKDGTFVPRAVTRDPNSAASRALAARGAEVVAADLGDKESVKKALKGAEVAFGVTVPFTSLPEITQGRNMIDAAKEEGIKYFVFSSLASVAEISKGKYTRAAHFEDKVVISKYLQESGLPNSRVIVGYFLENFIKLWGIKKTAEGFAINMPFDLESRFGYSWVGHDLGPVVTGLFKIYPEKLAEINNIDFDVDHDRASLKEMINEISKELGKPIAIEAASLNGFAPLEDMRGFGAEFDLVGGRPIPDPKLEALGIKQEGTIQGFVREVLKPILDKQ